MCVQSSNCFSTGTVVIFCCIVHNRSCMWVTPNDARTVCHCFMKHHTHTHTHTHTHARTHTHTQFALPHAVTIEDLMELSSSQWRLVFLDLPHRRSVFNSQTVDTSPYVYLSPCVHTHTLNHDKMSLYVHLVTFKLPKQPNISYGNALSQ